MTVWNKLATAAVVEETAKNLRQRGVNVIIVRDGHAALQRLQKIIPSGSQVMTGSSTTLQEIGFIDLLQTNESSWQNVQAKIWNESDENKRAQLRRQALTSEYFVASANALARSGEIIAVDATGSRVGAFPFAAEHLILVVGTQKIVESLAAGMQRIREYVFPLEDERAKVAYGVGSRFGKWVIIEHEATSDRITVILVEEKVGF